MPGKSINVVLANMPGTPLTEEQKREMRSQIQTVSPRINLKDISNLMNAERRGEASARQQIDDILKDAEVFFGMPLPNDLVSRAPQLKWIQSPLAGTDQFLTPAIVDSQIVLTKARIHDVQISETVFSMILMLARRSLEHFRLQEKRQWVRLDPTIIQGKTVGILGLGNIGLAVARLAKAFGMTVLATKAHPEANSKNVDFVFPPSGTREVLSRSDFLVVLLPITPDTKNLIGEAELRLMKPTAYLINVSRGGIVDEEVISRALKEHWIAGAAFDVFASDPRPLSPESKLWDTPNLIITPHNAGHCVNYAELVTDQFCKNLNYYIKGKELLGVVDKKLGY
jgi:D-2-hydroxyacid dehydrogenase (NADP+)